jgi:hypothetical protein
MTGNVLNAVYINVFNANIIVVHDQVYMILACIKQRFSGTHKHFFWLVLHSGRVPVLNAWLVGKDKGMMTGKRVEMIYFFPLVTLPSNINSSVFRTIFWDCRSIQIQWYSSETIKFGQRCSARYQLKWLFFTADSANRVLKFIIILKGSRSSQLTFQFSSKGPWLSPEWLNCSCTLNS